MRDEGGDRKRREVEKRVGKGEYASFALGGMDAPVDRQPMPGTCPAQNIRRCHLRMSVMQSATGDSTETFLVE